MISDYVKFALTGIRHQPIRSWLTMVGVFVGITAVVALISIGEGMQAAINEQFQKVGTNRIVIVPGSLMTGPPGSDFSAAKLDDNDLEIVRGVRGVEFAAGGLLKSASVKFEDQTKYLMALNTPTDSASTDYLKKMDFFQIGEGRYLRDEDKYKAIVGYTTARELFDKEIRVGNTLVIEGKVFEVVGIGVKTGNPVHDNKVSMPLKTAREIFNTGDEISEIFATVKDGFVPADVAKDIEKKLRKDHNVKEGEEDFSVNTVESLVGNFSMILNIVQMVLTGIASISLVVGGVGIMNTMYTSVLERTRQIGIMKAIGARNSDIMLIFLIEAGMLGIVGGVIGIVLGLAMSKGVELIALSYGLDMLKAYISPGLVLGALAFSFTIGSVSGLLPARKAANMNPVDALRK